MTACTHPTANRVTFIVDHRRLIAYDVLKCATCGAAVPEPLQMPGDK